MSSSMRHPLWVIEAGIVPYGEAVALQERIRTARRDGLVPDVLLLLEHPPVITLGRASHTENLLVSPERLQHQGVELYEAARGGDVTYHGPGQLVGYPIFHLNDHGRDVHRFLRNVEEVLIRTLAAYRQEGTRVKGLTGVWVGNEKVAAIGIGVRQWVTWHGFALNISTGMDAFQLIVPCGIRDRGVTSLERLAGQPLDPKEVTARVIQSFGEVFHAEYQHRGISDLPPEP
jgi:lipoyl(octanoyl) transferase